MNPKERLGHEIAKRIKDGQLLGIGTGSTVDAVLKVLGERVSKEKLKLRAVVTSYESAATCAAIGIEVLSPFIGMRPEFGFDGADEVDSRHFAIKGKGGALLKEKIVAASCKSFTLIVDESKVVKTLGEKMPIPVEVLPDARGLAQEALLKLGAREVTLRACTGGKHGPIITEHGNLILDAHFTTISDGLESQIKSLLGVVESGLFSHYANEVLVASDTATRPL